MPRQVPPSPTDEELDRFILTRYALMGVDVSVLPASDPDAPMDLERLLEHGRSVLRDDAKAADVALDPQRVVPMPFPAPFTAWTGSEDAP